MNYKYFLAIVLFFLIVGIIHFSTVKPKDEVLGLSQTPSVVPEASFSILPSPTISPSFSPTPTASSSATPMAKKLIPTPSPKPTPHYVQATSMEVNSFIDRFASQYGIDPNVLRHIAVCESGFNSNAISGNYVGLYQFGPITWSNIRKEFGEDSDFDLRFSAEESVQTAAYALSRGKEKIWPNCVP